MKKIFYIESIDIHNLYGTGGGPMLRYSAKVSSDFVYITFTSKNEDLLKLHTVKYNNQVFNYIPIASTIKTTFLKNVIPLNLYFAIALMFRFKKVCKLVNSKSSITKTYSVLWYFSFIKKSFNVCYVFPGLENPLEIGRFSSITKYLKSVFNFINIHALSKAQAVFVAGSLSSIQIKNSAFSKKKINVKIIKIPQVVDSDIFYKKDVVNFKKILAVNTKYRFSFLGRLTRVKGIDLIIDAFELFHDKIPNSSLFIIGEGEDRKKIQDLIIEKKLQDCIILLGKIAPPVLIDYINVSDAGIFASYAEGFSNAMLEYLACGTPIISTNVGGVDELIIEGETGFVIRERDASQFLSAMLKAVSIDMSSACLRHVEDNYQLIKQWEVIERHWQPLILNNV